MNSRVREVRKAVGLTMEAFGHRIGVAKSTISNIENGLRNISEHMAKSICREFNVNYEWLTEGNGNMFAETPQSTLDELCRQYDLDDLERSIIEEYLKLNAQDRAVIRDYIKKVVKPADSVQARIDREVEEYRRQLELEASQAERSSASPATKEA